MVYKYFMPKLLLMDVESGATAVIMEEAAPATGQDLDFIKFVENPTWKDVLLGLVNSEQIDPWNIDIVDITTKYISVVREMKKLDLRIPANMVLAAAIMVRLKSEALVFKETYESDMLSDVPPELNFNVAFNNMEAIPELTFRAKFPKKRKVTLDELLGAVEDALASEMRRESARAVRVTSPSTEFVLEIEKVDVEKAIRDKYGQVLASADQYNLVKFSDICGETPKDMVLSLLAVLYLHSYQAVDLRQASFFGEIIIKIIDRKKDLAKISLAI